MKQCMELMAQSKPTPKPSYITHLQNFMDAQTTVGSHLPPSYDHHKHFTLITPI